MRAPDLPTVVVPVFNGFEDVERCLRSLAKWPHAPVVLVDDASTDPRIRPLLAEFARAREGVTLVAAERNGGFIASANLGARVAPEAADLLFLNSDAEVSADALAEMAAALARRPDAAICCPLSNSATFLSAPRYQQEAPMPGGVDAEAMAALLRECAGEEMREVEIPTAVGFCMLVRRGAWRTWGPFDASYGRGYGEDDELAQRARAGGGAVVCAPRAFVAHRGHGSFGRTAEVAGARRANGALLVSRWPGYPAEMAAFCRANPLRPLLERLWDGLLAYPERRALHVLHVTAAWPRGSVLEIARATRSFANHTIVVPTPDRGAWVDAIDGEVESGVRAVGLPRPEERFARFLAASPAALVHAHGDGPFIRAALDCARRARRAVLATAGDDGDWRPAAEAYRRAMRGEVPGGPP